MQRRDLNAPDAPAPVAAYTQAIEVTGATRTLYISGQVGQRMDGTIPADIVEQSRLAWSIPPAQLKAADMTLDNLVKVTTILPNHGDRGSARRPQRRAWRSPSGEHADRRRPREPGLEDRGRGHRGRVTASPLPSSLEVTRDTKVMLPKRKNAPPYIRAGRLFGDGGGPPRAWG